MKLQWLLFLLLAGCVSQPPSNNDRIVHTVMAYHPAAQVVVHSVQKQEVKDQVVLVIGCSSVRPVTANVFTLTTRGHLGYGVLQAYALQPAHKDRNSSEISFSQHMRDYPDGEYIVVELVTHVQNIPAPVASVWVVFHWDKVFLWDHQRALSPESGGYLAGDGFYRWSGSRWESADPQIELRGALAFIRRKR